MRTAIILGLGILFAICVMVLKLDNKRLIRSLTLTHILFLGLTIFAILLAKVDWGFRGAYTERIIASIWFGTGIALFGLYRKGKAKLILKVYSGLYFWTIPILTIAWFIPRLHFAAIVFGLGIIMDGEFKRYPIDNTFQVQTSRQGMLSGCPSLSVVESKFIFFEKVTDNFVELSECYEKIEPSRISNDSIRMILKSTDSEIIDTTLYLPRK